MQIEESQVLPPNWSCHFDNEHRTNYYYNKKSGITQWEKPYVRVKEDQSPCRGVSPKDNRIRGERSSRSQMPLHMLADAGKKSGTAFFDIHDCYSDMEEDDNTNIYTVPVPLARQEKRLFNRNRIACEQLSHGTNQDYLELARLYKLQRPYSDINYSKACVLCRKKKATHVLFPCEHRCICASCMKKEEICADSRVSSMSHGCCNCPLCAAVIKRILPFEHGKEIERYWSWVYEFPPPLPEDFLKVKRTFFIFVSLITVKLCISNGRAIDCLFHKNVVDAIFVF